MSHFSPLRSSGCRRGAVVLFSSMVLWLLGTSVGFGQGKNSGTFLSEAIARVTNNAGIGRQTAGYGYSDGISVLAGWIDEKKSLLFTLPLEGGRSYLVLAAGDKDAEDVDLDILDANGKVMASDARTDADASVAFTPTVSGRYTLKLTLFKSRNQLPCICVATVLKKNGWNLPIQNLDDAAGKLIAMLAAADQQTQRNSNKRLDFRRGNNQWAVYGGVLKEGETVSVTKLQLGTGLHVLVGVGDRRAEDVDLFLLDRGGATIAEDMRTDPEASIVHDAVADTGPYGLKIRNFQSRGPALVMMAVFAVR